MPPALTKSSGVSDKRVGPSWRYTAPPGMENVVRSLKKKRGINPFAVAWSMFKNEKHVESPVGIVRIVPPSGSVQRGIRTLYCIGDGKIPASESSVDRLFRDAADELSKMRSPHEKEWKFVLNDARDMAHEAVKNVTCKSGAYRVSKTSKHSSQGCPEPSDDELAEALKNDRYDPDDVREELTGEGTGLTKRNQE